MKFTLMVSTTLGWLFHWFFQGLKMWFFLIIPLIVFSLINGFGSILPKLFEQTIDIESSVANVLAITLQVFALFLATALSTYYFAEQLDVHPFRKYAPKRKRQKNR